MSSFLWWVVTAVWVVGFGLFFYWARDKPARRSYLRAACAAFGVATGLQALAYHLVHSHKWTMWCLAASAALLIGSVIWDALRKAISR
jgi:hypothetical protein